jgi:hypothetical protein
MFKEKRAKFKIQMQAKRVSYENINMKEHINIQPFDQWNELFRKYPRTIGK